MSYSRDRYEVRVYLNDGIVLTTTSDNPTDFCERVNKMGGYFHKYKNYFPIHRIENIDFEYIDYFHNHFAKDKNTTKVP